MKIRQLETVVAFLDQRSFAATGERIGLSASAVSIQMLRLEQELGVAIFDRTTRPPTLTPEGSAIAEVAREILSLEDRIRRIARGGEIATSLAVGFVPTTLKRMLPKVVGTLRDAFPDLQINIRSGLSGELAGAVIRRELDFALISSPREIVPDLKVTEIAREALFVIGPTSLASVSDIAEMATALPFIAFNRRAWLGQQIAAELQSRSIVPREGLEIDSLDIIEELVAQGIGVSVVPQRLLELPLSNRLKCLPFGNPPLARRLSLIEHVNARSTDLEATVRQAFDRLATDGDGGPR